MAQASVLTDNEVRRVFRIIETTRHADRNRLAFILSVYAGLRVGEIAALTIGDVATQDGQARREIKLGAHQTKGSKGRTVVLSNRVRGEIDAHLNSRPNRNHVPHLLHRSAMVGHSRMSAYRCCSRKSTKPPAFGPHRIRDVGLLRRGSMPREWECGQFRSLWAIAISAQLPYIATCRTIRCGMRWSWCDCSIWNSWGRIEFTHHFRDVHSSAKTVQMEKNRHLHLSISSFSTENGLMSCA
jgi:Phage integrase family